MVFVYSRTETNICNSLSRQNYGQAQSRMKRAREQVEATIKCRHDSMTKNNYIKQKKRYIPQEPCKWNSKEHGRAFSTESQIVNDS